MTRRRIIALLPVLIAVLLTGLFAPQVSAAPTSLPSGGPLRQNYSFGVPQLIMANYVQADGSLRIIYDITFANSGSPIDIIDIGTPNKSYTQMSATIDGQPVADIRTSTYIDTGVEIHLGAYAIPSGSTGTLHFEFTSPDMVYADTTNQDNASLQITPTWFDSSLIRGTSTIQISVATLPGIQPDQVVYQDEPFSDKTVDDQGRVVAFWQFDSVSPTKAYRVGVSFPRTGMTNVIAITFWDLLGRWLGKVLPAVGSVVFGCLPVIVPLFIVFIIVRAVVRAGKPNYLPPIAQVEGGGIKRGLTAPEAAVLLELPLNKILGMVVFGMLEKGLIHQTKADPLTVEVVEDFRTKDRSELKSDEDRQQFRRKAAQQKGTVIHAYEYAFLDRIEAYPDKPINAIPVVLPMEDLVNGVAAKMKGFDLSDTQDYYRRVIDRAVEQASAIGDIEQRQDYLDQYLPWVMMQPNYRPVLTMGSYHYWPAWARQPRVGGGLGSAGKATGSAASGGGRASTTTFGDVSASFAGWAETTMGTMAAAILPTSLSKPTISSGSSSGGSFHSSCACACAGCACACACAGGGR